MLMNRHIDLLQRFHCRFVLNELIQTEKDYVKDLGIVVEVSHTYQTLTNICLTW